MSIGRERSAKIVAHCASAVALSLHLDFSTPKFTVASLVVVVVGVEA